MHLFNQLIRALFVYKISTKSRRIKDKFSTTDQSTNFIEVYMVLQRKYCVSSLAKKVKINKYTFQ